MIITELSKLHHGMFRQERRPRRNQIWYKAHYPLHRLTAICKRNKLITNHAPNDLVVAFRWVDMRRACNHSKPCFA